MTLTTKLSDISVQSGRRSFPTYALVSDSIPLKQGGGASHVLSWTWSRYAGSNLAVVISHLGLHQAKKVEIEKDLGVPLALYRDCWSWKPRIPHRLHLLRSLIDLLLFICDRRALAKAIKKSPADRLFGFVANDFWFLLKLKMLARSTGLPLDVYLVDDLEDSMALHGRKVEALLARHFEPRCLRIADRVFVISPGYCEHLMNKYRIASEWLGITLPQRAIRYIPIDPPESKLRTIVFIGAMNFLYEGAVRDLLAEIDTFNQSAAGIRYELLLLTYTPARYIDACFGKQSSLRYLISAPAETRESLMRQAVATFVPYSLDPSVKTMVTTSFPSKLAEAMTVGRPVLVYGPSYASAPRYFLDNGLSIVATSRTELQAALENLPQHDQPEVVARYAAVLDRYHSVEAIRGKLQLNRTAPGTITTATREAAALASGQS